MNRITSPIVCLFPEVSSPPTGLRTEEPPSVLSWTVCVPTCNPFYNIDLESTVLSQVQKAFTCFNYILDACCVDCPIEDEPDNLSSNESAVDSRIVI